MAISSQGSTLCSGTEGKCKSLDADNAYVKTEMFYLFSQYANTMEAPAEKPYNRKLEL